jgi:hypothetical protein
LLVFKKYKKIKKNQIDKKRKKVEGPILRFMQHFTYKYWSTTQTKGGAILTTKKRRKKPNPKKLNLLLLTTAPPPFNFRLLPPLHTATAPSSSHSSLHRTPFSFTRTGGRTASIGSNNTTASIFPPRQKTNSLLSFTHSSVSSPQTGSADPSSPLPSTGPNAATPNRDPAPPYQQILFFFGLLVASFFG